MWQFREDNTFSIPNSFEGFLFNTVEQISFQSSGTPFNSLILYDSQNAQARLRMTLFIKDDFAMSPLRSPFGGMEFDESITLDHIFLFLDQLEKWLRSKSVKGISIVSHPYCYNVSQSEKITHCLLRSGYSIIEHDMNFHLDTSNQFTDGLHASAIRRYTKNRDLFLFSIDKEPDLEAIFNLVEENRFLKGNPVTITSNGLKLLYQTFADKFVVFTLRDGERIAATAFGVWVSPKILYYYLPADKQIYKKYSPATILIGHMFDYCKQNGIPLLDLGISTSKSIPNWGLIRYKRSLGGEVSLKLTFEKKL